MIEKELPLHQTLVSVINEMMVKAGVRPDDLIDKVLTNSDVGTARDQGCTWGKIRAIDTW